MDHVLVRGFAGGPLEHATEMEGAELDLTRDLSDGDVSFQPFINKIEGTAQLKTGEAFPGGFQAWPFRGILLCQMSSESNGESFRIEI